MAVVESGPGTGRVIALGRSETRLGRGPGVVDLDDPEWSREHVGLRSRPAGAQARLLSGSGSARHVPARRSAARRRLPASWRRLADGDRIRSGSTVLRLRGRAEGLRAPRPVVRRSGSRRGWRILARFAPALIAPLIMLPLLLTGAGGRWRLAILALPLLAIAFVLLGDRDPGSRVGRRPGAAELLLLAGGGARPAGGPGDLLRLRRRSDARAARRRTRDEIDLEDGDAIGVTGPGAERLARWLLAQVLLHEPTATCAAPSSWRIPPGRTAGADAADPHPARAPWHVTVVEATAATRMPPPAVGRRHVVVAVCPGSAPAWCHTVRAAEENDGVGATWLDRFLRAVDDGAHTDGDLPDRVLLDDLVGPLTRATVARRWASASGLAVPIGRDVHGVVEIDLVRDGPHALLAGATGSGKSEALMAWLTALAASAPPDLLGLVLVDYKGGSAFAPLGELPHVAAVLTDLDPSGTTRALASLTAELRRREEVLAAAGAKDIADLHARGERMARLVIVVDEFRALADEHPALLADLVRLAAQGRSLGLHLVLATQRPAGIVSADVRANVALRLCLRVLDPADSRDVIGEPTAAHLPPVPGRAVLGGTPGRTLQVAWLGPAAHGTLDRAVAAVRAAAAGRPRPTRPWAPPLPDVAGVDDPVAVVAGGRAAALVDEPALQRIDPWIWSGETLLVLGGAGTGRTSALRALAAAAGRQRWVHVVGGPEAVGPPAQTGTLAPPSDPRLVLRLLELLAAADSAPGQVLLVDDVELLLDRLDSALGTGRALGMLPGALRGVLARGHHVALAGAPGSASARWAEVGRSRLVLSPRDAMEASLAGVDRALVTGTATPGRAVLIRPSGQRVVQVLHVPPGRAEGGGGNPGGIGGAGGTRSMRDPGTRGRAPDGVPLLAPLPTSLAAPPTDPAERAGRGLVVGVGGDRAEPTLAPLPPGGTLLVVGPAGSGRSGALGVLADRLSRAGLRVERLSPGAGRPDRTAEVVLVDDLDRRPPGDLDALAALPGAGTRVIAAVGTQSAMAAHRPPLSDWLGGPMILLRPDLPMSGRVVAGGIGPAADPLAATVPGRAVLVVDGRALPVQLPVPGAQPPAAPR
ncbi:FtsK/SpoIIIE family protein [Actinomycetales bacterium JB111]|nr:FtsK/SpoIIIE family protein [Actinomycetales bacterium JB111]